MLTICIPQTKEIYFDKFTKVLLFNVSLIGIINKQKTSVKRENLLKKEFLGIQKKFSYFIIMSNPNIHIIY